MGNKLFVMYPVFDKKCFEYFSDIVSILKNDEYIDFDVCFCEMFCIPIYIFHLFIIECLEYSWNDFRLFKSP